MRLFKFDHKFRSGFQNMNKKYWAIPMSFTNYIISAMYTKQVAQWITTIHVFSLVFTLQILNRKYTSLGGSKEIYIIKISVGGHGLCFFTYTNFQFLYNSSDLQLKFQLNLCRSGLATMNYLSLFFCQRYLDNQTIRHILSTGFTLHL